MLREGFLKIQGTEKDRSTVRGQRKLKAGMSMAFSEWKRGATSDIWSWPGHGIGILLNVNNFTEHQHPTKITVSVMDQENNHHCIITSEHRQNMNLVQVTKMTQITISSRI